MRRHTSRLMKRIPKGRKGERSITGLQAAIVLIAFVVVSSMLAFATIPTRGDSQDITRAETAIVLVAFVALSLVFSVAFHSAGLFSSDKSRRTMKTGLAETGDIPEAKLTSGTQSVDNLIPQVKLPNVVVLQTDPSTPVHGMQLTTVAVHLLTQSKRGARHYTEETTR